MLYYKTFFICRTSVRAVVRVCLMRKWCAVPNVTLETPHFTLRTSSHLISSDLFSPHLSSFSSHMSSKFFSTIFISSRHCLTFLISPKLFLTHVRSSVQQKALTVKENLLYTITVARRKLLHGEALSNSRHEWRFAKMSFPGLVNKL